MLHLIYVDNNPDDIYVIRRCLKKISLPIKFSCLTGGRELLNYLQKKGSYQDRKSIKAQHFILLDIDMPEIDGFEVLSKLKKDFSGEVLKIPIIMFSGSNRKEDKEKSRTLKASGYLIKSDTFLEMAITLNNLLICWSNPHKTPMTEI